MNLIEHPHQGALIDCVSDRIQDHLQQCLAARASAAIALSGGSTPMPIYAELATTPVDWSRVTAVPTDERWVRIEHPASNAGQIRKQFESCNLKVAGLVPYDAAGAADPRHAESVLAELPAPLDLVMVGMGADAHFASLFPHSPALQAGLDPASKIAALALMPEPLPPEAPFARISMTLARLINTRRLLLVVTGEAKREVLDHAARADADERGLPIAALLRAAGHQLEIFWSP